MIPADVHIALMDILSAPGVIVDYPQQVKIIEDWLEEGSGLHVIVDTQKLFEQMQKRNIEKRL